MMTQRHRSSAELPPAPLDFAFPLAIPGPEVLGGVILHEAPGDFSLHLYQALRYVMAWAQAAPEGETVFAPGELGDWEAQVLTAQGVDEALWAPVAVIAGELCRVDELDVPRLTRACLAVTDWAIEAGAHGTALLFAEAAAAAWPNNPRLAWMAGRLYRELGNPGKAELWGQRARRVAVWTADHDVHALNQISLGKLRVLRGDYPGAREYLNSAVRAAKRHRLPERHASALHNLFAVATYSGRFDEAESYARQAAAIYGADHPDLINLAFDVSHFWTQQGHFARALSVLRELEGRFDDPDRQLRVAASTARAAGAMGEADTFHHAWSDAWALLEGGRVDRLRAAATLELGLGALNLRLWAEAEKALTTARSEAERRGEGDTLAKADAALENLGRRQSMDDCVDAGRRARVGGYDLAGQLARSLMEQRWAPVERAGAHDG